MHGVKIPDTATPDDKPAKNCRTWKCYIASCSARNHTMTCKLRKTLSRMGEGARDRARFLVQVRARLRPCWEDAAFFRSWRGHAAREKRKDTYRPPHDLVRGSTP